MKKLIFILFIALGLCVVSFTQAEAGCKIVWSGDGSGEVATNETSRTQQASLEAYNAIQWQPTSLCSIIGGGLWSDISLCHECTEMIGHYGEQKKVCIDGYWEQSENYDWCAPYGCILLSGQWDVVCEPTLIDLSSLTAIPKSGTVNLNWATDSEIDNAGFNIYRAESENGEYTKINEALIPAQGSATEGVEYNFLDENVFNRLPYLYLLEDVDNNGLSTFHGPVKAVPRAMYGIK